MPKLKKFVKFILSFIIPDGWWTINTSGDKKMRIMTVVCAAALTLAGCGDNGGRDNDMDASTTKVGAASSSSTSLDGTSTETGMDASGTGSGGTTSGGTSTGEQAGTTTTGGGVDTILTSNAEGTTTEDTEATGAFPTDEPYSYCDDENDCMQGEELMYCFPLFTEDMTFISGFCSQGCMADEDCAPPPDGFAIPTCITRLQACILACPGGPGCPDGMECYETSKGDFCF